MDKFSHFSPLTVAWTGAPTEKYSLFTAIMKLPLRLAGSFSETPPTLLVPKSAKTIRADPPYGKAVPFDAKNAWQPEQLHRWLNYTQNLLHIPKYINI